MKRRKRRGKGIKKQIGKLIMLKLSVREGEKEATKRIKKHIEEMCKRKIYEL